MRLKSISIYGFRNLKKAELQFPASVDLYALVGPNGHGKTNFLEAIYLLGLTKSFRTNENQDLIAFDNDFCRLVAKVEAQEELELAFVVTESPAKKTLKINDVQKIAADYIGNFQVVFFSPDDMNMIHGSPSLRRRYLDVLISQLNRDYLTKLMAYQKVVKQRNALLKSVREKRANAEELNYWDDQLAELGHAIQKERKTHLKQIDAKVQKLYESISGTKDTLKIKYETAGKNIDSEDDFKALLMAHRDSELISGATSVGPHRDDLKFDLNSHNISAFGSRGEWRSLILALKFAEIELLEAKSGQKPVLLLDDVFSELDEKRQKYLFESTKGIQTFISTTHLEFLEGFEGEKKIYQVKEGGIE